MNRIPASARFASILCFAFLATLALAQSCHAAEIKLQDVITFTRGQPDDPFDAIHESKFTGKWKARRGQVIRLDLTGVPAEGWYTYPISQRTPQQFAWTKWMVEPTPGVIPLWPVVESPALSYRDQKLDLTYYKYVTAFTWSQEFVIAETAPVGLLQVSVKLKIQVCDKNQCIKFDPVFTYPIEVSDEASLTIPPELAERIRKNPTPTEDPGIKPATVEDPAVKTEGSIRGLIRGTHEEYKEAMDKIAKQIVTKNNPAIQQPEAGLLAFILTGIFWGAISLVTPCVFPMIPITVSYFLKQSEKEHHRPIVMASIYSLTIVVVLTVAASSLLTGFQKLSVHPVTNYFIGGLFVFFALSLFGMYEIELPSSLAQFTSAREGKGGIVGTIFMALTFTIISFACVAPFLGGFGGTAADARPWWHNVLGGLAFSTTFASPFFFLALFPALLRKMPKSGSWLNSVKVVMGFLELAAAFKFFRTAELIQSSGVPSFFTFDFVLGLWIAMCLLCAVYLIGMFRLPHDTPEEHISVPRLLFSAAFLGLAFYLTPALFKVNAAGQPQRPGGTVYAWIDSFLLPDTNASAGETPSTANLPYAVSQAREELKRTGKPKRIFIDFTGVSCTNCKINEKNVFIKPNITKLFATFHFVKLYTDTVPPDYYAPEARSHARSNKDAEEINYVFRNKVFDKKNLPLYVILEPQADTIRVLGVYPEGRINDEAAFAEFLSNPEGK
jgi:thiol:disulfide interchange protein